MPRLPPVKAAWTESKCSLLAPRLPGQVEIPFTAYDLTDFILSESWESYGGHLEVI